jgi:peptidoglycan hydrolase-like protein with peptidoglycan-binding domain
MNSGPRLAVGALGRDVQRAQTIFVMMKALGFDQIDGVFGAVTRNAVIAFQQGAGLVADGVIGDDTWKRMPADPDTPLLRRGGVGNAVSGLQKGLLKFGGAGAPTDPGRSGRRFRATHRVRGEGVPGATCAAGRRRGRPADMVGAGGWRRGDPGIPDRIDDGVAEELIMGEPVLKRGSNDPAVQDLQQALKALGYDPGAIDGVFGAGTESAVKAFQQAREITADGIVGRVTWINIDEADQSEPVLRMGSSGLPVRRLQSRMSAVGFDMGGVDGRFGPKTEQAVKQLQQQSELGADGVVGARTWAIVDALENEGPAS